jgi:hypothetical protein
MIDFILVPIISFFLGLFTDRRRSDHQKDFQILLLRQQLRIWQRPQPQRPHLSRWEKLGLAVRLCCKNSG